MTKSPLPSVYYESVFSKLSHCLLKLGSTKSPVAIRISMKKILNNEKYYCPYFTSSIHALTEELLAAAVFENTAMPPTVLGLSNVMVF